MLFFSFVPAAPLSDGAAQVIKEVEKVVVVDKPVEVERVVQVPVVVEKKVRCCHEKEVRSLPGAHVWFMSFCQAELAWTPDCVAIESTLF